MRNDSFRIVLVFLATVLLVYGMPGLGAPLFINQVIFLLLLVYVFNAKDNIFWLVWFFIVENAPGRLFIGSYAEDIYRLPFYTLGPGIALGFSELFILMYIVKSLKNTAQVNFMFGKQIRLFIGIALFYFGLSFFMGISVSNMIYTVRSILPWSLVLIIPRYVRSRADLERVFYLLVPIMVISFLALIQSWVTGTYLHYHLSGLAQRRGIEASEESLARTYSSETINYVLTVLSVYFLSLKKHNFNPNLLIFVTILGTLSVFLAATRGWITALLILFASYLFVSGFGFFRQFIRFVAMMGLVLVVLTSVVPVFSSQSSLAFQRYLTMVDLAQGDLTAGGTLIRLDVRGPRVMEVFRESPVIGWAFSNTFHAHKDGHVGNQTNLLNFGILGFIAINLIYLSICFKTYQWGRRPEIRLKIGNSALVFLFALLAFIFIHSSSALLWGFVSPMPATCMMFAFIFAAINAELGTESQIS